MKNAEIERLQKQGYGYRKIATILSMSPNTVKSYIKRNLSEPELVMEETDVCLFCGEKLVHFPKKKKKKFCSKSCKLKWWHNNSTKTKNKVSVICKCCGKEFLSYESKHSKYCSRACYDKVRIKVK